MPIVHMYNEVTKHLENNEIACSLFLDLKKAFDTVNIKILLKKLQHIGIRGCFFNPRPAGPLDFPRPAGGGCLNTPPPSISAPAHRRTKRKTAFESLRKIISKSFRSFFGSGQN